MDQKNEIIKICNVFDEMTAFNFPNAAIVKDKITDFKPLDGDRKTSYRAQF
jgi:hypothetical protein